MIFTEIFVFPNAVRKKLVFDVTLGNAHACAARGGLRSLFLTARRVCRLSPRRNPLVGGFTRVIRLGGSANEDVCGALRPGHQQYGTAAIVFALATVPIRRFVSNCSGRRRSASLAAAARRQTIKRNNARAKTNNCA